MCALRWNRHIENTAEQLQSQRLLDTIRALRAHLQPKCLIVAYNESGLPIYCRLVTGQFIHLSEPLDQHVLTSCLH